MSSNQPNILIITTDQQRFDSLSCYGSQFTSTPALDWLADHGTLFERAYCANPVCTPARASIYSGQYPSRHGAWNVGVNLSEDVELISHHLNRAGYTTSYIGKAHFQAFDGNPGETLEPTRGWELLYPAFAGPYYGFEKVELAFGHSSYGISGHYGVWVNDQVGSNKARSFAYPTNLSPVDFGGNAFDWNIPLRLHNSVWTADRAVSFLESQDRSKPFLLAIGFEDPHHPHCVPLEYKNRVDPQAVPLPRYNEGELEDKPPHFLAARTGQLDKSGFRGHFPVAGQGQGADFSQVSDQDARLGRAYYYSLVRLVDQQIGRILNCLDQLKLAENTLIIFTTDHGELLGDHGLWMKGPFLYEELVRIPLILRWPAGLPSGNRIQGLASHVDLAPTILAAAGLGTTSEMDGVNLLPLLRGEESIARKAAVVECTDDPQGLRLKSIITTGHKMTFYHQQDFGELYDLSADPGETVNHWSDPLYAEVRQELLAQLLNHMHPLERRSTRIAYA